MPIYYVEGGTGSGKGTWAVRKIKEYLDAGRRVATNMDLYLEHLQPPESNQTVIRIPDLPNADHLNAIGYGSPEDNKNKDEYGLLVLDEISLFLDTAVNKEFKPLMKWLVQRRKFHWDVVLISQSKDQSHDTAYKSLTDNLVTCKADDLVPIPYFSDIMKTFGFKGMLPEAHTAFTYNGKSPTASIINVDNYKNKPYRQMYNTDQRFDVDELYLNGKFIDMRAVFTYLPASILTRHKYIAQYEKRIEALKNPQKETDDMAKKATVDPTMKFKIAIMIVGVVAFLWWKNPMDNPLLADSVQPEPVQQPAEQIQQLTPQIAQQIVETDDMVIQLFNDYRPRLAAHLFSDTQPPQAFIDFYEGGTIVQRFSIQDFKHYGYTVIPSGTEAVIVRGKDFNKRVTSFPLQQVQQAQVMP